MRAVVNPAWTPAEEKPADAPALAFHRGLAGYVPSPLVALPALAQELGVASLHLKDESDRFGLPAFKVLGASWAIERLFRSGEAPGALTAATEGNHGRAVAHVAARRGLPARIFVPAHTTAPRRAAIAAEGAEVVVVEGGYDDAVREAAAQGAEPGWAAIADVELDGAGEIAAWVAEGYATIFAEAAEQLPAPATLVMAQIGVGAFASAAVAGARGARVVGVEPESAACVTESLAAGQRLTIAIGPTIMAGMHCATPSVTAWPALAAGLTGCVTVSDAESLGAVRDLAEAGVDAGTCGAAGLAGLRALLADPACADLRAAAGAGPSSRVLLVSTEGTTDPLGAGAA